jgi:hypothetical protein
MKAVGNRVFVGGRYGRSSTVVTGELGAGRSLSLSIEKFPLEASCL